jgi:hypothetical protein
MWTIILNDIRACLAYTITDFMCTTLKQCQQLKERIDKSWLYLYMSPSSTCNFPDKRKSSIIYQRQHGFKL